MTALPCRVRPDRSGLSEGLKGFDKTNSRCVLLVPLVKSSLVLLSRLSSSIVD